MPAPFEIYRGAGSRRISSNHRCCYRTIDTALAKITRVISYDRPGYLKSETCNKTRDAITIAKELKEALSTAGYPHPIY
ncbi:MAG: hypothetical protein IPN56_15960 [Chitinophagaceae bacterium]|nr:hypothetical protein [Chitinophagaceae bacterium]